MEHSAIGFSMPRKIGQTGIPEFTRPEVQAQVMRAGSCWRRCPPAMLFIVPALPCRARQADKMKSRASYPSDI